MNHTSDADPTHREYLARRPARYRGYDRTSSYLTMRDGARIAIDVCLPRGLGAGEKIPTILRQTRYFRRFRVASPLRPFLGEVALDPMNASSRQLFTSRGYAWVDVDVRGSGASFGERPCPWWLDGEVADGAEIASFIVNQPWSNGRIGATGVSYEGTTAEFLAITRHPAVKAIAPRFSLFDIYPDVAFPGGLHNAYFTHAWETANAALDRNAPGEMVGLLMALRAHGMENPDVVTPGSALQRLVGLLDRPRSQRALRGFLDWALAGVAPVDDRDQTVLDAAIAAHRQNHYVHDGATEVVFRDDVPKDSPIAGQTQDGFSPHTYAERARDSGVAVLSYGGWFDGGYANATIKRHQFFAGRGGQLLVGPWGHGGQLDLDPDARKTAATFDHAAELLRFFDPHLVPERAVLGGEVAPVRYFLMGDRSWRTSHQWPPAGTEALKLHFAEGRKLTRSRAASGVDVHDVDLETRSGTRTRWRTLLCPWIHADGKGRSASGWLVYESDPLEEDLTITGNPILELELASTAIDGAVIVYLEDVDASGDARLFTEGTLRLLHATKLVESPDAVPRVEASFLRRDALELAPGKAQVHVIELLPAAIRVRRGHRLRLVLGGADRDHFTTPVTGRVGWTIHRAGSRLLLPVSPRRD